MGKCTQGNGNCNWYGKGRGKRRMVKGGEILTGMGGEARETGEGRKGWRGREGKVEWGEKVLKRYKAMWKSDKVERITLKRGECGVLGRGGVEEVERKWSRRKKWSAGRSEQRERRGNRENERKDYFFLSNSNKNEGKNAFPEK